MDPIEAAAAFVVAHWNDHLFGNLTVGYAATIITAVIGAAKLYVSSTATPDPSTPWGKVYKVLEVLALIVGKAKDDGAGKAGAAPLPPLTAILIGLTLMGGLAACGTFQAPVGRPPVTKEQQALMAIDIGLAAAGALNDVYIGSTIYNADTESKIALGLKSATSAAVAAEVPVFGCPMAVWRDTAQACGTPSQDKALVSRLISDAQAAVKAAQTIVPDVMSALK